MKKLIYILKKFKKYLCFILNKKRINLFLKNYLNYLICFLEYIYSILIRIY
jgi:hypothetical protein